MIVQKDRGGKKPECEGTMKIVNNYLASNDTWMTTENKSADKVPQHVA